MRQVILGSFLGTGMVLVGFFGAGGVPLHGALANEFHDGGQEDK
ncbi:MAG: hypothetical protein RRA35_10345 [Desulfomonilia bacterium]|nr:hypothetical protein [Desulfomonilia bacterium]